MTRRILFHVGWPKTGSTSLQHHLFAAAEELVDLSNEPTSVARKDRFVECLMGRRPGDGEAAKALWTNSLSGSAHAASTALISSEDFLTVCDKPCALFKRIASLAPDAEIFAIVRDQVGLIRSLYDMYPSPVPASGTAMPVDDYLDWRFSTELCNRLKFDAALAPAVDTFGRDRVHVFSYLRLFAGQRPDAPRLAELLGVQIPAVHAAIDAPQQNDFKLHAARRMVRRILGPVHASWFLPRPVVRAAQKRLARTVRIERTVFTEAQAERIRSYYAADNAAFLTRFPEVGAL